MNRPQPPTLAKMKTLLRPGMSRDEFFLVLDELAEEGLALTLPAANANLVGLPVAEGGELLCFVSEVLTYVEYEGDIFLELEDTRS
jgi:hypothetical protein